MKENDLTSSSSVALGMNILFRIAVGNILMFITKYVSWCTMAFSFNSGHSKRCCLWIGNIQFDVSCHIPISPNTLTVGEAICIFTHGECSWLKWTLSNSAEYLETQYSCIWQLKWFKIFIKFLLQKIKIFLYEKQNAVFPSYSSVSKAISTNFSQQPFPHLEMKIQKIMTITNVCLHSWKTNLT